MNPLFHTDFSISDSLKNVRKSVLIYETIIVFRILRSYGEVDEIPAEMLKSSLSGQIDSILGKLEDLLKQ